MQLIFGGYIQGYFKRKNTTPSEEKNNKFNMAKVFSKNMCLLVALKTKSRVTA